MIFTLRADPYQTDIVFCIEATQKEIEAYMVRVKKVTPSFVTALRDALDMKPMTSGRTVEFDNGVMLIYLRDKVVSARTMGLLVHEVHHAVNYILRRVGMEPSEHTEEAYAYLNQHICEQAFRKIGNKWWK